MKAIMRLVYIVICPHCGHREYGEDDMAEECPECETPWEIECDL